MPEKLMVRCKSCGNDFESPVQVKKDFFDTTEFNSNHYECPHCSAGFDYTREDHFFVEQ